VVAVAHDFLFENNLEVLETLERRISQEGPEQPRELSAKPVVRFRASIRYLTPKCHTFLIFFVPV
jgi:hypothetical protein